MIVFSKDIPVNKLLTAYNNHIVRFNSNSGLIPVTAQIVGLGINVLLYPHPNGTFYFNFSEYISAAINTKNFADDIDFNLIDSNADSFTYDVSNGFYLEGSVVIKINFVDTTSETISRDLKFYMGVDQLEDYRKNEITVLENTVSVLSPVEDRSNNITYLKYWEGYPFEFSFFSNQPALTPFILKNVSNGLQQTFAIRGKFTSLFLSDGRTDTNIEDLLPLVAGENNLQFFIGGVNQNINLILDKEDSRCGIYIKFLNKNGRFNYWLLSNNSFRTRTTKYTAEIENDFRNIEDTFSPTLQFGKTGEQTMKCAAEKLTSREKLIFEGIIDSPKIYLFTGDRYSKADITDWIELRLKTSSFPVLQPKTKLYSYYIELELPARYTQTL